jgi:hypothetical protein
LIAGRQIQPRRLRQRLDIRGESHRLRGKEQAGLSGVGSASLPTASDGTIAVHRPGSVDSQPAKTGQKHARAAWSAWGALNDGKTPIQAFSDARFGPS